MKVREQVLATSESVDALASAVTELVAAEEPADLEDVVLALRDAHAVVAQLRDAVATLAEYGASLMPQRQMSVAGIPIERTGGRDRSRWQHDDLLAHVVRWAREDRVRHAREHDGELPAETEAETAVRLVKEYAGKPGYWKVTALREERGIDADEYCESKPARPGIKMPRSW